MRAERVQAIVDRDFLASADAPPREDLHARAHRVRFARVIEITACRQQDRAPRVNEPAEVPPVFARERPGAGVRDGPSVPATEDELTFAERAQGEDAQTLAPRIAYGDIDDHGWLSSPSSPGAR